MILLQGHLYTSQDSFPGTGETSFRGRPEDRRDTSPLMSHSHFVCVKDESSFDT